MRTHPLALPDGSKVLIKPLSAKTYFCDYLPLAELVDEKLQALGGWAPLVLDRVGWGLLEQLLELIPISPLPSLSIELFGDEWWRIPPLLTEVVPELHKLPKLEFKRLTSNRGKVQQSKDPLTNLILSCPEGFTVDAWLSLDPVTIHEFQWVRNQSSYLSLSNKEKGDIATAELFDKEREEALKAREKMIKNIPGLNLEDSPNWKALRDGSRPWRTDEG